MTHSMATPRGWHIWVMGSREEQVPATPGPETLPAESHAVAPGATPTYPVDFLRPASVLGSHTEVPIAYGTTPFGAPVARPEKSSDPWLSPAEVAARLKVNRATVYGLIRSDALHHRRIGLQIRISIADLDEFLRR